MRESKVVVAPQGFTVVANKRDMHVFHIAPHTFPHIRNKASYPDSPHIF